MKGLVLYRSHFGNTKLVAEEIARKITVQGHEVILRDVRQELPELQTMGFFVVGSPTRFARPDGKALNVLKEMKKLGLTETPVAIFDTYGPAPDPTVELKNNRWFYPGAAGIMYREAEKHGLKVYSNTLRCAVQGGQKGPLANHQLEKATIFTEEFLSGIEKPILQETIR